MRRKLLEQAIVKPTLNPVTEQSGGSDINGVVIDRFGYDSAVLMSGIGAISGTPTSLAMATRLQTGDAANGSDMADVTGYTLDSLTTANTNTSKSLDLSICKRYIRAVFKPVFVDGTSPKVYLTGAIALGDAKIEPAT